MRCVGRSVTSGAPPSQGPVLTFVRVLKQLLSCQRPARARPGRFGGEGVAAMAASSAAAAASCGRGATAAGTAGGDGAVTVVTASVTTRAASGALAGRGGGSLPPPPRPSLAAPQGANRGAPA